MENRDVRKSENYKDSRLLNQTGSRLRWVRNCLELSQREIADVAGIPLSSYNGREAGVRSVNYDEFVVLSEYLNPKWISKFKDKFPEYGHLIVDKINPMFLMFGYYD